MQFDLSNIKCFQMRINSVKVYGEFFAGWSYVFGVKDHGKHIARFNHWMKWFHDKYSRFN